MHKLNIIKKIPVITLVLVSLLFLGVKCDRPESIGPDYILAPEGFSVISFPGNADANFTAPASTYGFNASFSHSVSWTLNLKGLRSGAVKKIRGTSQSIDGTNPSWLWDGSHEGLFFFMKNEQIELTLTFLGSSLESKDTITLNAAKTFKNILISDFEGPASLITYGDAGAYYAPIDTAVAGFKMVQGIKAFKLSGLDVGSDYFVAGMRKDGIATALLPNDPDSLYFNIFVHGTGDANSKLNFGAQENDNDGPAAHEPASDDEFQVQITLDHIGWKLFSYKYTDLIPSPNPSFGGNGNKTHEPKRITGITFALISAPPGNNVTAIFDFPILTFGGPFDPAK